MKIFNKELKKIAMKKYKNKYILSHLINFRIKLKEYKYLKFKIGTIELKILKKL